MCHAENCHAEGMGHDGETGHDAEETVCEKSVHVVVSTDEKKPHDELVWEFDVWQTNLDAERVSDVYVALVTFGGLDCASGV